MATNTTSKLALGQLIVAALVAVTSKLTKPARDAFMRAFNALADAEAAVTATEAQVAVVTALCQTVDDEQDRATRELAARMSGDGFGRINPFKLFDVASPSTVCSLGDSAEADIVLDLSARVMVHPKSGLSTKKAAASLARAATAMKKADADRTKALVARAAAIERRDSSDLPRALSVAITNLRSSIKYADYVEKTAHYRNVFPRAARATKKPAPVPVPAPVS